MKTRLAIVLTDHQVDDSENKTVIPVGRTYDSIHAEMVERFKHHTDEDFQTGARGIHAKSRSDHLRRISCNQLTAQLGYEVAGAIMGHLCNYGDRHGDAFTLEIVEYTEEEWAEMEKRWEEEG